MRRYLVTIAGITHVALARSSCAAVCNALAQHPQARAVSAKAIT